MAINEDRAPVFCQECLWYGGTVAGVIRCEHWHAFSYEKRPDRLLIGQRSGNERNVHNDCQDFAQEGIGRRVLRRYGTEILIMLGLWILVWSLLAHMQGGW